MGGSLGSSSPGFLGTHSPGTPDLGSPFPVASLWDIPFGVGRLRIH